MGTRIADFPADAHVQDVVAMPIKTRSRIAPSPRQARRVAPTCRGGASSLLRLTQPGASRLPSTLALSGWIDRAAQALRVTVAPAFAPSDFRA